MIRKSRRRLPLTVLAGIACCLTAARAGSGPNTALPFADDFEPSTYANLTPLVNGTNGWYASSAEAMVQDGVVYGGVQAAQVPIDVTLSNQFSAVPVTNVWVEMMVRPVFYDGGDTIPEVSTNATAMFYLSSNGYLVVHNGSPIGSTNWLVITNRPNGSSNGTVFTSNTWLQLHLFQDFTNKTCFLFANGLLMTNDIPFVNSAISNFSGFDVYNGSGATTFLDNVWVMATNPPNLAANSSDFVPGIGLGATNFSRQIFAGQNAQAQSFDVWKTNGFFPLRYTNTATTAWVNVSANTGVSTGETDTINLTYSTAGLAVNPAPYRSVIAVDGQDTRFGFASSNAPAAVDVLLYIQGMTVAPGGLTNLIMQGHNAANQAFDVVASGAGSFTYTVSTNGGAAWVAVSPGASALTNQATNTITLTYAASGLAQGQHTDAIRVASPTGGGATQDVGLVMNVQSLSATPAGVTNFIMRGNAATAQSFAVESGGAGSFAFGIVTNGGATWLAAAPGAGTLTDVDSATIAVTYTTAALAAGSHTESFKAYTAAGGGATQTVNAVMNVQDLQVTPAGITNLILAGGNPASQNLTVASLGAGTFAYAITTNGGAAWLAVSPGAGTLTGADSDTPALSYSAAALAPGAYSETLQVATSDGGGATQTVTVALNVQSLGVSTNRLTNQVVQGQVAPSQTFQVQSGGAGSIPYTVSVVGGTPWLSPAPAVGTLVNVQNDTITLTYSTAALAVGVHTAVLHAATTAGGGATQAVTVVMTVTSSGPGGQPIQVSPTALSQTTTQGQNPPSQTFAVSTTNAGPIAYSIAVPQGGAWITPAPTSGTLNGPATNTITLSYLAAGLLPGVHTGFVDVSTADAGGATQRVTVIMTVAGMSGPLLVSPTLLTNAVLFGETAPSQDFSVYTTGSVAIAYTVTVADAAGWLAPAPLSGVLTNAQQTDSVAVAYSTAGLAIGAHTSRIEVATADDGGATQSVFVLMTVFDRVLPPPGGVSASAGTFADRVRVQWNSISNADSYTIWRHTSNSTNDAVPIGTLASALGVKASVLEFDDLTAAPGVLYYFWVKAHNAAGPSPFSASTTGWRGLEAPAAIAASQGDYHDRIAVAWTAVAGASTYEVWRGLSADVGAATRLGATSATALDDTTAAYGATHYYWVRSGNGLGFGPFSAAAAGWHRPTGPGDFDGDGKADGWFYYQPYGMWYLVPSTGAAYNIQFGWWETEAAPGDYDGDGRLNLGVYHRAAGMWYIALNNGTVFASQFGNSAGDPVPADYDGDGAADLGVYFPDTGAWYVLRLDGRLLAWNVVWGGPGLRAVRGDFDGDRKDDLAVYDTRNGCWYVAGLDGTLLAWAFAFGWNEAEPVSGDFDGDHRADFAVYYPAGGMWYIYTWQGEFRAVYWGWSAARPVPADFDGDGRDDIAVFHHDRFDARWYLLQSTDGYRMISSRENR